MARVEVTKNYVAFDGAKFPSKEECDKYETDNFVKQFANKKIEKIVEAFEGTTEAGKALAQQFEKFGDILREKRYARGEKAPRGKKVEDVKTGEAAPVSEGESAAA